MRSANKSKKKTKKTEAEQPPMRNTLFTNLSYVIVNGVRTQSHALLLEGNHPAIFGNELEHKLRGFSYDGAVPTFDLWLEGKDPYPYTLTPAASQNAMFMGDSDKEPKPLFTGAILTFPEQKIAVQLITENQNFPIDEMEFTGKWGEFNWEQVWNTLKAKVAQYWEAPYMPVLTMASASHQRSLSEPPQSRFDRLRDTLRRNGAFDDFGQ